MRFRSIHDQRGATAIEYAIIAGLIGLGLVGSLVTTRGSLSAVFGTAGSRMGSATASQASGQASASPRAPYWEAKTLVGAPTKSVSGGITTTAFRFSDGTTASLASGYTTGAFNRLTVVNPNDQTRTISGVNANGSYNYVVMTMYDADMAKTISNAYSYASNMTGDPPTPTLKYYDSFDSSGNAVGNQTGPIDPQYVTQMQNGYYDARHFAEIAK